MSQQAVDRGQLDDALTLIELAQVRADRVVGTGRAMISCDHARILGAAGRADDCRGAVAAVSDDRCRAWVRARLDRLADRVQRSGWVVPTGRELTARALIAELGERYSVGLIQPVR